MSHPSIPLLSIILNYIITLWPHVQSHSISAQGDIRNIASVHANYHSSYATQLRQKRLTPTQYAAYERARRCHDNCNENMPLFIGAVLTGLLAEGRVGKGKLGLDRFAVAYLACRVVYVLGYLYATTPPWTLIRTVAYNVGSWWSCVVIGRAAWVLGS